MVVKVEVSKELCVQIMMAAYRDGSYPFRFGSPKQAFINTIAQHIIEHGSGYYNLSEQLKRNDEAMTDQEEKELNRVASIVVEKYFTRKP